MLSRIKHDRSIAVTPNTSRPTGFCKMSVWVQHQKILQGKQVKSSNQQFVRGKTWVFIYISMWRSNIITVKEDTLTSVALRDNHSLADLKNSWYAKRALL